MKHFFVAALTGAALLLPALYTEAAVSSLEQTLGRAVISRPVLEGLQEQAHRSVEQDLDKIICELTDKVARHDGATGRLCYQVMSDTDMYTSLLLTSAWTDKKGKTETRVHGVLYEKKYGARVSLQAMLGGQPRPERLEPLRERFGLQTPKGDHLAAADCGKIKRVPADLVIDSEGRLYLLFQPGELTAATDEPLLLLIAKP